MEDNDEHKPNLSSGGASDTSAPQEEELTKQELSELGESRRQFLADAGAVTATLIAAQLLPAYEALALEQLTGEIVHRADGAVDLRLRINGHEHALKIEPRDPDSNLPWSSRSLVECFRQGAARFGWDRRRMEARSMRDGRHQIGLGVASATYPTSRRPASARVRILPDGSVLVQLAATDIGTGTYTALTQVAADALGLPAERVKVEIGDSNFPPTPGSGGSWGVASYGSAVHEACLAVRRAAADA
jgi:molybdopterin-binding aldehyde dehydrogenase-like protein